MAYSIRLPDGTTVANIPDTVSFEDAKAQILQRNPELAPKQAPFSIADTGLAALQSGIGATKSMLQGFGAETAGVETLDNAQKSLGKLYSPARLAEMTQRDALEKAAAKSNDTLKEIGAYAGAVREAPLQSTASAIGSSVPTVALSVAAAALAVPVIAAAGVVGVPAAALTAAVGVAAKYMFGALQGAGSVKGSIYDAVKEDIGKQFPDLSPAEIAKISLEAQNFTGKNWDNILAGTAIGGVAGGTGLEKDLLRKLSKPVAAAAAKEAGEKVAQKGVVAGAKRVAGAGLKEAVPEFIQGGQEKFATNVAETRAGFETPAMEGVLGAGTKEGLMGFLGGAGVQTIAGPETAAPSPTQQAPISQGDADLKALYDKNKLARQQEQMGVQQGRDAREGEKILDAEAKAKADQEQAAQALADQATAKEMQEMRARRQAELEQLFPRDYNDVMQKTDAYGELYRERQALGGQTQTQEVKSRTKIVDGLLAQIAEEDTRVPMEYVRMQYANSKEIEKLPADMRAKNSAAAFTSTAPQQVEMREAINEQPLVPQTDLQGNPVQQIAPEQPASGNFKTVQTVEEAQAALDAQRKREARGAKTERDAAREAGQLGLFTRVGTPTAEAAVVEEAPPVPEPIVRKKLTPETIAPVITGESLGVLGIGPTAVLRRSGHAIQGLDITKPEDAAEVKNMLTIYKEGRSPGVVAKLDTFLARPEFQGIPDATPVAKNKPKSAPVARANKPSVGVPNKSAAADMGATGTGVPATTATSATPDGRGLVPAGQPAGKRVVAKRAKPAPIKAKFEPKKVEPKKVEPKKVEPKKVEPKKSANPFAGLESVSKTAPVVNETTTETVKPKATKPKSPFDISGPSEIGAELQAKSEETTEGKIKAKAAGKVTRSRITEDQAPVGKPISHAALEGIVADAQKSLGGNVDITILDSAKDLNSKAPAGAAGLVEDGRVYLFRDGIQSGIEGAKTVFHELFHLGLQKLLTNPKEYFRVMNNLYRMNTRVRGLADKWIASEEGQAAKEAYAKQYTDPQERSAALSAHAADEALARIAEELKTGNKIGTGQRAFVRSIAKWLANVAEAIGLRQVAQSIRSATYTQVEMFVQEAMSAAVSAGPANMEIGPRGSVRDADMQLVEAIQAKIPEELKKPVAENLGRALAGVTESIVRGNATLKVRQKLADKAATVTNKTSRAFDQGYRNAQGELNPDLQYRQAADSQKIVSSFFLRGGIRLREDGLTETFDTKDSPLEVIKLVTAFSKSSNIPYEKASTYVSSLLEGHRLYDLRETQDKALEASAVILEQQGKNKEADAERAKKIRLHMDNADIDTLENLFQKTPEAKSILDTMSATRAGVIDYSVATGRITPEQGEFWKDNAAYVPFNRIFEDTDKPLKGRGSYGISSLRNIPTMKGSFERPVGNVIDAYVGKMGSMITEGLHNHASYQVLDTMALTEFAKELSPGEKPKNKDLTIKVYREGKPIVFEVDTVADYEAFQTAPEVFNWAITSMMPAARLLRLGVTATPMFAAKQVIEDAFRAMFNSGVKRPLVVGMRTLYNFPRIIVHEALQAMGISKGIPMLRQMDSLGIVGDYDLNIVNPAEDLKIAAGASKRGAAKNIFHALEAITKASDLAARLAVFEETMRESGGNTALAQHRARELINFSRRGSDPAVRALSRVVPFMNAYAQGMDMLYRTASGLNSATGYERAEARKQFYKKALMMTALGFMYAFAVSDDEGYKNAPDHVRDNNFLIPGTGKKITLPKELGFIFKSIPERLVGYYQRSGTDEEQSIVSLLGSIITGSLSAYGSPNATPTLIKPLLENMTNYSFFLQRELESPSLQKLDPSQRYNASTSELAKSIGNLSKELGSVAGSKIVEVSPTMVDNFLRGIFGLAGSTALLITDALINPTRPDRPLYQMPFASLFLYDIEGGRSKNEFYDLQKKVGQADATFKSMIQADPEKAQAYQKENAALLQAAPILNNTLKQLSDIRKMRVMYEKTSDKLLNMTGTQRAEEIEKLKKYEIQATSYIRKLAKNIADTERAAN